MATRPHAAQAVESGAAQQVQQHGLGLVVGRVAGEDVGREHREPCLAGPGLEIGTGVDGGLLGPKGSVEPRRGGGNEVGLSCGVGPKDAAGPSIFSGTAQPRCCPVAS